jgi:3-oxoacyl-[acyl-carrier-protein] synthase-1
MYHAHRHLTILIPSPGWGGLGWGRDKRFGIFYSSGAARQHIPSPNPVPRPPYHQSNTHTTNPKPSLYFVPDTLYDFLYFRSAMKAYAGAENIITSLGFSIDENIKNIKAGKIGIANDKSGKYSPSPLPLALTDHDRLEGLFTAMVPSAEFADRYTMLEMMFIVSITEAIQKTEIDIRSADTLIIISSTKGNIDLLAHPKGFGKERVYLSAMAGAIGSYFKNPNTPLIISNACISGVLGIGYAERLIKSGKYRNVVVSGGDLVTEFVVSGFQSFQSLSNNACKPFDKDRDGLNLGEGCGSIIMSSDPGAFNIKKPIEVLSGAGSNDANHISGPSRTGEGLLLAIEQSMKIAGVEAKDIDSISAHGTATDYNDEMEAKAFFRAGLEDVPLNSYKGYIGHTLGAAGVIEAAISLQSMKKNTLFRSSGYDTHGVTTAQNVISKTEEKEINCCLKTASGFGGSNAAVIFQK